MRYECHEVERIVWTDGPDAAPHEHLVDCVSCREESRRAADLQAALTGLKVRYIAPPEGLEADILGAVGRPRFDRARGIITHPNFWKGAAVAGAAAATAAAGLLVARRRTLRPEPELVA